MSDTITLEGYPELVSPSGNEFAHVSIGGVNYKIKLSNLPGGGGGGDVTAPTIVSATCPNGAANTIVVVFSESVAVTTAGWSFKKNGSSWSVSSVSGSGTTWTFTMGSSASGGDTLLRSYNSVSGSTTDTSSNELSSFTDVSVTNSVGDVTAPTVTSATVENADPDTIVIVFSEAVTGVSASGWSFKKNGSAWSISTVTGSGTTWNFNMATAASNGDTLLRSYNSATGATIDGSSNELVTFTDSSITNNVAAGYDTDAQTYFTAVEGAGGTISTPFKDAWDDFVIGCKGDSLWSLIHWVNPYYGGTLAGVAIQAKAPASFAITWTGTPTVDATGITGNGTTQSGDTGWDPYTNASPSDGLMIGYYGRNALTTQQIPMGAGYGAADNLFIWPTDGAGGAYVCGGDGQLSVGAAQVTTKFHIGGNLPSNNYYYRDGSVVQSATDSGTSSYGTETVKVLGCSNGGAIIESDLNLAFGIITKGLTAGNVSLLTGHVNTLMTAISRNV